MGRQHFGSNDLVFAGVPVARAAAWRSRSDLWRHFTDAGKSWAIVVRGADVLTTGSGPDATLVRVPLAGIDRVLGGVPDAGIVFLGADIDEFSAATLAGSDLPDVAAFFAWVDPDDAQLAGALTDPVATGDDGRSREAAREAMAGIAGHGAGDFVLLRTVGEFLPGLESGIALPAVALAQWHAQATFCAACGGRTIPREFGWVRRCGQCGRDTYPRTDPAMIVTVVDAEDRLLLAHATHWPERRFSLLAGFIEAGEGAEAAVRREVFEETRVSVSDVRYLASQAWPFPGSLMLAYWACATHTDIHVDGVEVDVARWFTRTELAEAVASGEVHLPMGSSIAHALITRWLAGTASL